MIRILISILFVVGSHIAAAQITMAEKVDWKPIGKLRPLGTMKASLEYSVSGRDTIYFLFMKDFTNRGEKAESKFFSIKFNGIDNTFEKFYQLLKSFFLDENRGNSYTQAFRLGDQMVYLQHTLLVTGKGVKLSTKVGDITLSEGDIDKLFGKR
ncbi:MAG: hypothetical protein ABIO79_13930 [Ferruginibacter sp.]